MDTVLRIRARLKWQISGRDSSDIAALGSGVDLLMVFGSDGTVLSVARAAQLGHADLRY
jgi:predicted polyphosphate/ATP-dependent NAD kinase